MDTIHNSLEQQCKWVQYKAQDTLKKWAVTHNLTSNDGIHWYCDTALVVMEDNELRRGVTSLFHEPMTVGHPRISKTLQHLQQYYWWPNQKYDIMEYIMLFILYCFIVLRRRLSSNLCGSTTHHLASFLI